MQLKWMGLIWDQKINFTLTNCCRIIVIVLCSIPSRARTAAWRSAYSSFIFRSSSATGHGAWVTRSTGSTAANAAHWPWALYHTACSTVIVVGVDTLLNDTTTATGTTSKAIEENTKPSIVVTTIAATAELAAGMLMVVGWPPSPPLPPTQRLPPLLTVAGRSSGSELSRALHFTVQLSRSGARSRWRRWGATADGVLGRVRCHVLDTFLHAGLVNWFHDLKRNPWGRGGEENETIGT